MEDNNTWEQKTIKNILELNIKEQRARRRWGIFFKLTLFVFLFVLAFAYMQKDDNPASVRRKPFTAVVPIIGEISADKEASAANIIPMLNKAFETSNAKAVLLKINSPGGAPAQTNEIISEIKYLRAKYPTKRVYAVIEDVGASAAYMLACSAEAIYADESSIVGSIGVLSESFGLVGAIKKLGIERRLYTSGANKGMLDPFSPVKPEQVKMLQDELNQLHNIFITFVKQNRGSRLNVTDDMFSGRIWIGLEAKNIGLIDDFGNPYTVARDILGLPELVEYQYRQSLFSQLKGTLTNSMREFLLRQRYIF